MRTRFVRRTCATAGVVAIGLAVGAAPALAAQGTAYARAELVNGKLFGQTIVSPIWKEFPPGGTASQPSFEIPGVVKVKVAAVATTATGDRAQGKSHASVNWADAVVTIGVPNAGELRITENAIDSKCSAHGGVLTGSVTLAGARVQLLGPGGVSLLDVHVPIDPRPSHGVPLPNGLGEIVFNKQVRHNGVITVTGLSAQILGSGVELAKATCGPNIPTPQVPVIDPVVGGAAAGVALAGLAGFGLVRNRRLARTKA